MDLGYYVLVKTLLNGTNDGLHGQLFPAVKVVFGADLVPVASAWPTIKSGDLKHNVTRAQRGETELRYGRTVNRNHRYSGHHPQVHRGRVVAQEDCCAFQDRCRLAQGGGAGKIGG